MKLDYGQEVFVKRCRVNQAPSPPPPDCAPRCLPPPSVPHKKLTVLCAYQGQVTLIRKKLQVGTRTCARTVWLSDGVMPCLISCCLCPRICRAGAEGPVALEAVERGNFSHYDRPISHTHTLGHIPMCPPCICSGHPLLPSHSPHLGQGDENDYVLVSLVRSNNANALGFVKIENRITVAASRSRAGLYVVRTSLSHSHTHTCSHRLAHADDGGLVWCVGARPLPCFLGGWGTGTCLATLSVCAMPRPGSFP